MKTLKSEALDVISRLAEDADIDEIMYELCVLERVRKGQEAVERGEVVSVDALKEEMRTW